jgi:hypothetical protein
MGGGNIHIFQRGLYPGKFTEGTRSFRGENMKKGKLKTEKEKSGE